MREHDQPRQSYRKSNAPPRGVAANSEYTDLDALYQAGNMSAVRQLQQSNLVRPIVAAIGNQRFSQLLNAQKPRLPDNHSGSAQPPRITAQRADEKTTGADIPKTDDELKELLNFPRKFLIHAFAGTWHYASLITGQRLDDVLADDLLAHSIEGKGDPFEVQKHWVMKAPGWAQSYDLIHSRWINMAIELAKERYWDGERSGIDFLSSQDYTSFKESRAGAGPKGRTPGAPGADQFWASNMATLGVSGTVSWVEQDTNHGTSVAKLKIDMTDIQGRFWDRYDFHSEVNPVMHYLQSTGLIKPFGINGWWFEQDVSVVREAEPPIDTTIENPAHSED